MVKIECFRINHYDEHVGTPYKDQRYHVIGKEYMVSYWINISSLKFEQKIDIICVQSTGAYYEFGLNVRDGGLSKAIYEKTYRNIDAYHSDIRH